MLKLEGQLWNIIEFQHVKPARVARSLDQMRNVMSGKVVDKTFNAGLRSRPPLLTAATTSTCTRTAPDYVFMDTSDFDQLTVPAATVGDATNFMLENQMVNIAIHEGNPLYIELPPSVVLEITYTEPGLQGDAPPPAPSPPRSRPATRSRCRCSSRTTPRSRSTPATAATLAGSTTSERTR